MSIRPKNDSNNNQGFICGVVEGFYGRPWTFDQRKDLFKRLKDLKLNAFMYAPKDDTKHRARWRQPYDEVEANQLRILIAEAKANGIDFYYSLAPGLDMVYSDPEEVHLLVKKYDQLVNLGCESFAILFDDIEPTINSKDKGVFKNYASAQVSVTNNIFQHLNRPKFLFCPTEYCESRAVPNVLTSIYLNTIGVGLEVGIDIMWSGSRVISRLITEESIDELTGVIRRPPVIWENLHANDYDKKRVFLGPYSGRSTKIIPKLKGVLTNPNCEYEANYIAIHTLAQWSKCSEDINPHNRCNLDHTKSLLSTGNKPGDSSEQSSVYDPHEALKHAIRDWIPHLYEDRPLPTGLNLASHLKQRSDVPASNELAKETNDSHDEKSVDVEESNVEMIPEETQSSAASNSTNKSEMDTSNSPAQTDMINTNSCDSCDMVDAAIYIAKEPQEPYDQDKIMVIKPEEANCPDCIRCSSGTKADLNSAESCKNLLNFEGVSLLVDLFFLPFEHGLNGYRLLRDIEWLRDNHGVLLRGDSKGKDDLNKETKMNDDSDPESSDKMTYVAWFERAEGLNNFCTYISRLVNILIYNCPNKLLIMELYPYMADLRDACSLIMDYIKFLRKFPALYPVHRQARSLINNNCHLSLKTGYQTSALDRFHCAGSLGHKESYHTTDEQEPWVHRGGLIGDVQRLLSN